MPGKPVACEALAEELREEGASSARPCSFISHRIKSLINPYLPSRRYLRFGAECPDTPYTMIDFLKIRAPFRYFIYCLNIFANISASPLSSSADGSQLSPPCTSQPRSSDQLPGGVAELFGEGLRQWGGPSLLTSLAPELLAHGSGTGVAPLTVPLTPPHTRLWGWEPQKYTERVHRAWQGSGPE